MKFIVAVTALLFATTFAFAAKDKDIEAKEWESMLKHPRELDDMLNNTTKTITMKEFLTCSSRAMRGYIRVNGGFKKNAVIVAVVNECRIEYENLKSAIGAALAISFIAGGADWGEIEFKREGANALSIFDR
jgi:hypothetical protein